MNPTCGICDFFLAHLTAVHFIQGLAFFVTGIVVWLEATCHVDLKLAHTLPFLAVFGLLSGCYQWMEMFADLPIESAVIAPRPLRLAILVLSFVALVEFGHRIKSSAGSNRWVIARWLLVSVFLAGAALIWSRWAPEGQKAWLSALDAWSRYSLAIPGSLLAALGLRRYAAEADSEQRRLSCHFRKVALAFLLYGVPGQVFVAASPLPPSNWINHATFMATVHVPIQLFNALMAVIVAIFTTQGIRCFERRRQRRMEELVQDRLEAQRRLTEEMTECREMQRRLLQQTVRAQEEERRHIARELHDETAQALTALALGLAAVESALSHNTGEARARLKELRGLINDMMKKINQLTTRLRPTMLDDLGLIPALITYADESARRLPFKLDVRVTGRRRRLPCEAETNLYRIAQESVTNVARHAQADHASIHLHFDDGEVILTIADDGVGMEPRRADQAAARGEGWGLAGIQERAHLLGGSVEIYARPDAGTAIEVRIPMSESLPGEGAAI